jgi:hypothetical protein
MVCRVGEFFEILRKLNLGVAEWPLILLETGYAFTRVLYVYAYLSGRPISFPNGCSDSA